MNNLNQYDAHSKIHNFFFHPCYRIKQEKTKSVFAIITHLFLTAATAGLWQIPFWVVNRLDKRKVEHLKKGQTPKVNAASSSVLGKKKAPKTATGPAGAGGTQGSSSVQTPTNPAQAEGPKIVFGKEDWIEYFGEIGDVPEPPPNINQILESNCPIFPGKKVKDTHILVLVPKEVKGEPLTIGNMNKLFSAPKKGPSTQFRYFAETLTEECKNRVEEAHWVLLSTDVIERESEYANQKTKISSIATDPPYTVPSARDVTVCLFMHYIKTGNRLFPHFPETYTRCQDIDKNGNPVAVGGFSPEGVSIYCYEFDHPRYGMAAAKIFT